MKLLVFVVLFLAWYSEYVQIVQESSILYLCSTEKVASAQCACVRVRAKSSASRAVEANNLWPRHGGHTTRAQFEKTTRPPPRESAMQQPITTQRLARETHS
jgi:hypothetical protein